MDQFPNQKPNKPGYDVEANCNKRCLVALVLVKPRKQDGRPETTANPRGLAQYAAEVVQLSHQSRPRLIRIAAHAERSASLAVRSRISHKYGTMDS
jgi:hypothetical protein